MKSTWTVGLALACAVFAGPLAATAQSSRENAVAVDRVVLPSESGIDLERIATGLHNPWSLAFLPDGRFLVVEKYRGVRVVATDGSVGPLLEGTPGSVLAQADSGHHDIVLDPDFATNGLVYLAFVEGTEAENRTAVWRARFDGRRLTGGEVIFRVNVPKSGPGHPGGRLLFLPDKTLLLSVGDGFDYKAAAQDMGSHLGKVLRLTRDGGVPADNPFVGRAGVAPEIWTAGHRNIQGLTLDSATGDVWAHEHGPRGGDEINQLRPGLNYGWPAVTHGIDYDGTILSERAFGAGFERSKFVWSPSIAPSGLAIYRGDRHAEWAGKFFVGGLAFHSVVRLRTGRETGLMVEEARMLTGLDARIRDIRISPDGRLYLLTDGDDGVLLRLAPTSPPPAP